MDIRAQGWHMRLKIAGIGSTQEESGSLMELMAKALQALRDAKARSGADGVKRVTIELADRKITEQLLEESQLTSDAEALLDTRFAESVNPELGESLTQFHRRLVDLGYDAATALFIAEDAFGISSGAESINWVTDPRAIAFRKMNASQRSRDESDPTEYAALKAYCERTYPTEMAAMRLRE